MNTFICCFSSEWLKKKHSAAAWLAFSGGLFVPLILLFARFNNKQELYAANTSGQLWKTLYTTGWQYMGILLLPLGIILVTSLFTQVEFKNNTWKQLHTTPQSFTSLFFAKLAVILVMLLQCLLLFNGGMFLCGVIPSCIYTQLPYPQEVFPLAMYAKGSLLFLVACLPVVALQFLLGLRCRSFLVPVGVGLALYIAGIIGVKWQYGHVIPYGYSALLFARKPGTATITFITCWAAAYAIVFIAAAYLLYLTKKDKA